MQYYVRHHTVLTVKSVFDFDAVAFVTEKDIRSVKICCSSSQRWFLEELTDLTWVTMEKVKLLKKSKSSN